MMYNFFNTLSLKSDNKFVKFTILNQRCLIIFKVTFMTGPVVSELLMSCYDR